MQRTRSSKVLTDNNAHKVNGKRLIGVMQLIITIQYGKKAIMTIYEHINIQTDRVDFCCQ